MRDAADYITSLPKKGSDLPEWQTAIEALMLCSGGGPTMMARTGVMRALNRTMSVHSGLKNGQPELEGSGPSRGG